MLARATYGGTLLLLIEDITLQWTEVLAADVMQICWVPSWRARELIMRQRNIAIFDEVRGVWYYSYYLELYFCHITSIIINVMLSLSRSTIIIAAVTLRRDLSTPREVRRSEIARLVCYVCCLTQDSSSISSSLLSGWWSRDWDRWLSARSPGWSSSWPRTGGGAASRYSCTHSSHPPRPPGPPPPATPPSPPPPPPALARPVWLEERERWCLWGRWWDLLWFLS